MDAFTAAELRVLMEALSQFIDNSEDCDNTAEVAVAQSLYDAAVARWVATVEGA